MRDYLEWRSKLSLEDVFADSAQFSYPCLFGHELIYLRSLPEEKGRSVLVRHIGDGFESITPKGFSLRTKINEYGGKPYWLFDNRVIFVNQADQCLYSQNITDSGFSSPVRISPSPKDGTTYMYSDVHLLENGSVLCVVEVAQEILGQANNICFIGLFDGVNPDIPPAVIEEGADFYCNLVYHSSTKTVAWVEWSHPHMPWDENVLKTAILSDGMALIDRSIVNTDLDKAGASHCQLAFSDTGRLYYSVDFAGQSNSADYWNIFSLDDSGRSIKHTDDELEFGYPHWQYGDSRIVPCGDEMIAIGSAPDHDSLFSIGANGESSCVYRAEGTIQSLSANDQGEIVFIECGHTRSPRIAKLQLDDGQTAHRASDGMPLLEALPYDYPVSGAESLEFRARDGQRAHGFFYAPVSHDSEPKPTIGLPPLIVMVHGGPTARAYSHFDRQKQFWLSNGFAIFDVNPRGSTGYGRQYRDALYGEWGNLDISDVIDGINHIVEQNLVDAERVCIRGKSSGGYAVLRALTEYPEIFKAGTSYYGIGNLSTLAEVTHKFEKHYTDRLIGEKYQANEACQPSSEYYKRSPINKIDRIASAMLVLQGGEDLIVPPAVAHEVVQQLEKNNVPHEYREYPEEGHGFRQIENNIDAWQRELTFYRTILKK